MFKRIRSRLTMKRGHCVFVDIVSGKEVFDYVDCYGKRWLAEWDYIFGMRIERLRGEV